MKLGNVLKVHKHGETATRKVGIDIYYQEQKILKKCEII